MHCWVCGIEPDDVDELRTFAGVVRLFPHWLAVTGHAHAERPPTAAELEAQGAAALMRIYDQVCG